MHESYKKWLEDGCPKVFCECSCGNEIIIIKRHEQYGIPKYIKGHGRKNKHYSIHESYQKWLDAGCPKIFCKCGCGSEIIMKSYHSYRGIPEYISHHNQYGKPSWNKGILQTEETKINISIGMQNSEKWQESVKDRKNSNCGEKNPNWKEKIKKICPSCNNEFEVVPHLKERIYCSIECVGIAHLGKNNPNYTDGKSFEPYCEKFNEKKKEEVRNFYGRKCYVCNKLESNQIKEQKEKGKRGFKLSVHHVDNDKGQGCDGKPWKLIPLCLVCHMKFTRMLFRNRKNEN